MTSTPTSTQRRVETRRIQRVELCDIVNRFPGVLVNNKVCFDVNAASPRAALHLLLYPACDTIVAGRLIWQKKQ